MTNTAGGIIIWNWENPINLTATYVAHMNWQPTSFDVARFGNVSCNIWLLRQDYDTDVQIDAYPAVILIGITPSTPPVEPNRELIRF